MNSVHNMINSHLRNVQQLIVFKTTIGSFFAINISKVKAFIITKETEIVKNYNPDNNYFFGTGTLRGEPICIANFEKWIGIDNDDIDSFKIILYCEYSGKKVGFLIHNVIDIVEKDTSELKPSETNIKKISYLTYADLNGQRELITVFNAEQFLEDLGFKGVKQEEIDSLEDISFSKKILVAEDSKVAQSLMKDILNGLGVSFEMFDNGKDLVDRVESKGLDNIGLVITDIEMPLFDGYQVVKYMKNKDSSIPIVAHSSMTSDGVKQKMKTVGADEFLGKTNVEEIKKLLLKYKN